MPAKKVSSAAATTSSTKTAAAARLRKRSSLSLNGSTNGSEAPALAAVAAPVKRATVKARTPIASTPIAAQQAALSSSAAAAAATPVVPASAACSGAAVAPTATASTAPRTRTVASAHADPHTPSSTAGASVAAGTGSSSGATQHSAASDPSRKPTATTSSASKPLTSAVAPRPRASAASTPPPEAAAAVPTEVPAAATTIVPVVTPSSNSNAATAGSSMSAAPVVRRQRSNVGAPASAPTTAATAASTPALTAGQHSMLSPLSGPPTPPPQGPSTEAVAAPHGTTAGATTRPRRASATTAHADGATHINKTAATTESPSPPPAPVTTSADTAVEPHRVDHAAGVAPTGAAAARKRVGAAVASSSAKVRSAAKTPGTASVASTTDAAATHSSVERSVKKKVVRRGSDGGTAAAGRTSTTLTATTTTLASRRNSARGSVSVPPTASSTAPPTRDPSVALPPQTSAAAAAQPEPESRTFTTLNTARESVSEFESMALGTTVTTPNQTIASLGSFTRRSHGPVVSEEWARSIIKPGDEQLLYAPANAAFARTSSGTGLGGARGAAGSAQRASKGRSSPYDPQLRRAQQTVLQQRHIATPTPGRRSTRGVATGASAAPSAASGGSASRVGSTVKRSGTRLQQVRHEADERQRSINATLSTPNNEDGSVVRGHGSTVNNATGAPTPASPTPSRMSDGSVNTGLGGGGRLSAGTPISRRSTGSNDVPLEHIPGAASVMGGSYRHTPPGVSGSGGHYHQHQHQQQSSSSQQRGGGTPSLALFARPTPRIFATPSPRGSTGTGSVPGMTTFGVSNAPYYTGNEELTKLTRVREDMLRAMLLSSSSSTATATAPTAGAAAAASKPQDEAGATTPLSNSASSLLTMHVDPRVGEATTSATTSPSAPKRPRQRVYGVDIRPGAAGEAAVSPQKTPAADVSKPRGRLSASSNTAESILVSSIRQKPSGANGVSPSRSPSVAAGGQAGAATRPKLNTGEAAFSATDSATRLPRRSAVTVALTSLQPANALAERVRAELVRQQEQSSSGGGGAAAAAGSGDISKSDSTAATAAAAQPKSAPVSFEEATRRLLLDPFFPLVSEENYQRLVLQNDEYNERKELVVRICATPPPKPSWSASQRDREAAQPRRSGTVGPLAARALEMDLAEADEVLPTVLALDTTATPTTLPAPFSFATTSPRGNNNSTSSNNGAGVSTGSAGGSAAAPRRPSVQYGGPNTYPSPSQSRARSPSPSAMPTSPQMAASLTLPSAPSPAREGGRLLVNAVMPSEKTGPIKPLALSGVWYVPAAAPADATPSSAFQPTLSSSNLNNGAGTPAGGNSPHRAYSRSPSASRSSSRHNARRGSLLHGAQQNVPDAAALVSQSGSSDSESTASDDAVDEAEMALRRVLPRWGPFRTAAPAGPTTRAQNPRGASAASEVQLHPAGRRGKKPGDGRAAAAVLVQSAAAAAPTSTPGQLSPGALSPAMLDELDAYVHFFLKRFRNADADTKSELGDIPDTPLALQRAIRQSLRLSCGSSTNAEDDVEGVATELQDPLDDGSYHSQNVQYVLDLLGSLLQMQDSFCEDPTAGRAAARVSKGSKRNKARLTEADFLATVMWHPALDKSGRCDTDDDVQRSGVVGGGNVTRTVRKARARPLLRLRDPELHAVELMFALHNGAGAAPEKK